MARATECQSGNIACLSDAPRRGDGWRFRSVDTQWLWSFHLPQSHSKGNIENNKENENEINDKNDIDLNEENLKINEQKIDKNEDDDFDDFDDDFVENEEEWTSMVAYYVDEHIDDFVEVKK